jgi:hypothetical protein
MWYLGSKAQAERHGAPRSNPVPVMEGRTMNAEEMRHALIDASKKGLKSAASARDRTTEDTPYTRHTIDSICEAFLQRWYTNPSSSWPLTPHTASGSYFFLLWKNLSITNVSVAELLSLIRLYARERSTNQVVQIDLLGTREFKALFCNSYEALLAPLTASLEREASDEQLDAISEQISDQLISFYETLFYRTILFDLYWTSAIIHIPPTIMIDIGAITVESGYVHSSGPAIYFRNIEKAEQKVLARRMTAFVDGYLRGRPTHKLLVIPYADEFFKGYEEDSSVSLRNGLDGVRVKLRKHYVQGLPLLTFLSLVQDNFLTGKIIVANGTKDYSDERKDAVANDADPECTLWFITDSSVKVDMQQAVTKGHEIYLVAYAQLFYNYNQLNIYKERKPGWVASTTLPHTLSAALINIARYQKRLMDSELQHHIDGVTEFAKDTPTPIVILDPFCGTGTTLFDAILRLENATVIGMDSSRISTSAVSFNREFFSLPAEKLKHVISFFKTMRSELENDLKAMEKRDKKSEIFERAINTRTDQLSLATPEEALSVCIGSVLREVCQQRGNTISSNISDQDIIAVSTKGFVHLNEFLSNVSVKIEHRIAVYSIWRSLLMNTFSLRREQRSEKVMLRMLLEECNDCLCEFNDHYDLLRKAGKQLDSAPKFELNFGSYSQAGAIRVEAFRDIDLKCVEQFDIDLVASQLVVVTVSDSIAELRKRKNWLDVIITDPPFGFNEFDAEGEKLRKLYAELIPTLVGSLRRPGQLIMALPAMAKNGKQIPYYMSSGPMVRKVLSEAEKLSRRCVSFVETLPECKAIIRAPWYWGGTSTIERRILHFIIN